ncbi:HIT family protein [Candidatus Uhrbacteria bacterium CG10_big_fil_rev_8_21_14_0_10_50_16]|uniref:HIT family protein n=1 Tax=Candidatus Uhrbacteria bacterium CG10_big_fil_rev_8_21_14_0_10_50_16 TaxID=1975039 RepID=A0A2H0RMB0_9BACT|nr:MAG: HIT family protein [Candidatus Uhrbacteria bacterium CG10_big_fil_rev_8_21_14_0_10_50_16]
MQDCIFCKIVRGELPSIKVYEDTHVLAFMDIEPVAVGHVLVIPKEHAKNLYDASEESMTRAFRVAHRIGPSVANAVGAEGFHLTMNNGEAAWQTVFHPHLHILPRYQGDHHDPWKKQDRSREELAADAQKIQTVLDN